MESNAVESVELLVRDVQQGHWDTVLKTLRTLHLSDAILVNLYEQVRQLAQDEGSRRAERVKPCD